MKILYFHQHFSTPKGSIGTRSYHFSRELINQGHSVTIVCGSYWIAETGLYHKFSNGKRSGIVDGINVIEFDLTYSNKDNFLKRSITFFKFSYQGVRIALNDDYDVLFATSTPLTAGIPGIFSRKIRKKPFVFEVRDLWPELPKAMGVITNPIVIYFMGLLERLTYQSATYCIGLSPGIVNGIKAKQNNKKVKLIPNGCDSFDDNAIKISKKKFTAAFTGAHGIANGLDSVLNAAKLLIDNNVLDIEIQFIGDGALKNKLKNRAKNENLTNCTFIDPMPKKDLFKYLKSHVDVGLMILDDIPEFYYGTSPNKFFDYLSIGLPVLNNYPGWIAEIIESKKCGLVVKPNCAKEFSDALISMKNNEDLISQMKVNSKKLAKKEFKRANLSKIFVKTIEGQIGK